MLQIENKIFYGWLDFERDALKIAAKLKPMATMKHWSGIYAIPRGGLVLGVRLSHELGIPLFSSESYVLTNPHIIVVDEIADTGKTLRIFRENLNPIVTLWKHVDCPLMPDIYLHENRDWVVFPWEKQA